jgi:hypothetical protein
VTPPRADPPSVPAAVHPPEDGTAAGGSSKGIG